jgi:glycosyltransferase involved in cell wall biosynthesis
MTAVTAAICTYNRCESLQDTLRSLEAQALSGGVQLSILVVDNNSTDRTREVVEVFARTSRHRTRCLAEPRQGVGHARNRALLASESDYLAFIDDDAVAAPDWIERVIRCFEETRADMVGGKVEPLWSVERPRWLSDDLLGPIMRLDFGPGRKTLAPGSAYFLTTNCAVRRVSVARYGLVDGSLGRRGDRWIGGEDPDWCRRWLKLGARLVYEPSAVVRHKVEPQRVTPEFFLRWFEDIGCTQAHQQPWRWHHRISVIPAWRWAKLLQAWWNYQAARVRASDAERIRAECWWRFQRGFALERLDHWLGKTQCRFARA